MKWNSPKCLKKEVTVKVVSFSPIYMNIKSQISNLIFLVFFLYHNFSVLCSFTPPNVSCQQTHFKRIWQKPQKTYFIRDVFCSMKDIRIIPENTYM